MCSLGTVSSLQYLVKMMNAIRCRDMRHAEDALRLYFDWTAIHNDDLVAPAIARGQPPFLESRLGRVGG